MDCRIAGLTTRVADPLTFASVAVIDVLPLPVPAANPPGETDATPLTVVPQTTAPVKFCVLPSL